MMIKRKYYTTLLISVLLFSSCSSEDDGSETITLGDTATTEQEITTDDEAIENYTWKTYKNERFQFCVRYPEDFLLPQQEAQNADGRKFTGPNNLRMQVYGYNNVLGQRLDEALNYELENSNSTITDKEVHTKYYYIKGKEAGMAFQQRTYLEGEDFKVIRLEYPPDKEAELSTIISDIIQSFPDCSQSNDL